VQSEPIGTLMVESTVPAELINSSVDPSERTQFRPLNARALPSAMGTVISSTSAPVSASRAMRTSPRSFGDDDA